LRTIVVGYVGWTDHGNIVTDNVSPYKKKMNLFFVFRTTPSKYQRYKTSSTWDFGINRQCGMRFSWFSLSSMIEDLEERVYEVLAP